MSSCGANTIETNCNNVLQPLEIAYDGVAWLQIKNQI